MLPCKHRNDYAHMYFFSAPPPPPFSLVWNLLSARDCLQIMLFFGMPCLQFWIVFYMLWSTDVAGRVPHRSPPRPNAGCGGWHRCLHVFAAPNRANSARIGLYRPNRIVLAGGLKRPKSALNYSGTPEIGFEWGPNILNLSFLNFILNICCFFCVFFFVLCFLPSSFFVLWTKAIVTCFLRIF